MIWLNRILYWGLIKPVSLLPYPALYAVSGFLYLIFYRVFPYRKKIVTDNLKKSFPDKSEQEINRITSAFYRHFCDLIVESVKNFSISAQQAHSRLIQENPELINGYFEKGQRVIIAGGHYCNWELWAVAAKPALKHDVIGIYKRLSNAYFDRKMRESRGKFGLKLVPTKEIGDYMRIQSDVPDAIVFAVDQSPSNPKKAYWIQFLGRETAALFGTEKYATTYNLPVIWGHMTKRKRGYYSVRYELVCEKSSDTAHGEITTKLHQILEKDIRNAPEYWLWTHKRWKHKRPAEK